MAQDGDMNDNERVLFVTHEKCCSSFIGADVKNITIHQITKKKLKIYYLSKIFCRVP